MTEEELIDGIGDREGRVYAEPPQTDQPTGPYGITLDTLRAFLRPAHDRSNWNDATVSVRDLQDLAPDRAREVVRWCLQRLLTASHLEAIAFEPLRLQMLDFAYNSGDRLAIRWLQRVLRVERTGTMNDATVNLLRLSDAWLVNQALVAARLQMLDSATDPGGSVDAKYEEGLESRALKFSLLEVP